MAVELAIRRPDVARGSQGALASDRHGIVNPGAGSDALEKLPLSYE
jgi:hypothetical protein